MRRGLWLVAGAVLLAVGAAGFAADWDRNDSAPWHLKKVARLGYAEPNPGPGKSPSDGLAAYLHLSVNFRPDMGERKLHEFRVTDKDGQTIGTLYGFHKDRSLLVFEGDWKSLKGLFLEGLGRREPLVPGVPARSASVSDAPAKTAGPVVASPEAKPADRPMVVSPEVKPVERVARSATPADPNVRIEMAPSDRVTVTPGRRAAPAERIVRPGTDRVVRGAKGPVVVETPGTQRVATPPRRETIVEAEGPDHVVDRPSGGTAVRDGGVRGVGARSRNPARSESAIPAADGQGAREVDPPLDGQSAGGRWRTAASGRGDTGSGDGHGPGEGRGPGSGRAAGESPARADGNDSGVAANDRGAEPSATGGKGAGAAPGSGPNGKANADRGAAAKADAASDSGDGKDPGRGKDAGDRNDADRGKDANRGKDEPGGKTADAEKGPGSGKHKGDGTGDGDGKEADRGTGTGSGNGSGKGTGNVAAASNATGAGSGSGAGSGTGTGSGTSAGAAAGAGRGTGADAGTGGGAEVAGTGTGSGGGMGVGTSGAIGRGDSRVGVGRGRYGRSSGRAGIDRSAGTDVRTGSLPEVGANAPDEPRVAVRSIAPGAVEGVVADGGVGGMGGGAGLIHLPEEQVAPEFRTPQTILYLSCTDEMGRGRIYQVDDKGLILGLVTLPYAATGLALHREPALVAAVPREHGKIFHIDRSGKVSVVLEDHPLVPQPVDVGIAGNSDSIVVADNLAQILAGTPVAGRKAQEFRRFDVQKWDRPLMSVAATLDGHVVFATDMEPGVYRFPGNDFSPRSPVLTKFGGVAADVTSLRWAAAQPPSQIVVYEGETPVKTLRLPPGQSLYRHGLLSFAPAGSVVLAAQSGEKPDDVWLVRLQTKDDTALNLFPWKKEPILDLVVGPRMPWEPYTPDQRRSLH